MSLAALTIALTLLWAALTGNFAGPNLLLGAVLGFAALAALRRRHEAARLLRRIWPIVMLGLVFVQQLLASAVTVALHVVTPGLKSRLRPAIVAVPLSVKTDLEITLLANLITLTPGTLSLDVSDDRSVLYVHVLMLEDRAALLADIAGGFERRVTAVFA